MSALLVVWGRRLWPYLAIVALVGVVVGGACYAVNARALRLAHERTAVAEQAAAAADTVFVRDTFERRVVVTRYRALRDTARLNIIDTLLVARALDGCDSSDARSDSALAKAGRALEAHRVLEGATRTELRVALAQRPPRFGVAVAGGMDWRTNAVVGEAEGSMRVTPRWSVVVRAQQAFAAGEGVHRQLLVRYTF